MIFWIILLGIISLFISDKEKKKKYYKGCLVFIGIYLCLWLYTSSASNNQTCAKWEYTPATNCNEGGKYQQAYCRLNAQKASKKCVEWK